MHATARATWDDLLALPDHVVGEILGGELLVSPRPRGRHAFVASGLGHFVGGPFTYGPGPGGWWILDEPEVHLGDDVLVPDLAGWRRERVPVYPGKERMSVPPDWVCEVLSPSTHRIDRLRKMPILHGAGVGHLWLVDPDVRTLEVYRREPGGWLRTAMYADDEVVRAEPFDAIELDLGRWWLPGDEPPTEPLR